jgi:hypothetical protein
MRRPTPAWGCFLSCSRRFVVEPVQFALASVATAQASRMAACGEQCGAAGGLVHPHSAFEVRGMAGEQASFHCRAVASASLYRHPSDECFHRAPSLPYFPCFSSVTRFGAYPAPGGTRRSASLRVLRVSAFRKSFRPFPQRARTERIFRTFRKSTPSALGAGHTRVASRKSVPRAIGQIQTGEMTWHSTKTK